MGRNILVVEDDKNISDLIHMYLVKEGFDAVSYTHLDVYKRQGLHHAAHEAQSQNDGDCEQGRQEFAEAALERGDVYKRQA